LDEGVPLTRVACEQHIPLRTARRWLRDYRQHGLAGLARRPRGDRGTRAFPPELVRLIEGLALRTPPPSAAFVHRQVTTVAQEQGWRVPSYSTVYAVIRQLDPGLLTLAHQGAKAYRETFDLLYRREANAPNQLWQADHTPLDIRVLDERGKPARPWLTAIVDDFSRAVAGYFVGLKAPSALGTALTLHQAIWYKPDPAWHVCGIPEAFYTDHGSDFTSRHLEQVAADLHIQLHFSQQGQPRGRGRIERFFATVNQLFLCTLPGYAPAGSPVPEPVLTVPELDTRLGRFLVDDYHRRVHGETGVPPQERWEAGGFLPQLPASLEQLDLLLLTVPKTRRVRQDGIHFQGFRYLDPTLAAYVGEEVTIRYDPRDLGDIRVFHRETFLCRAVSQELASERLSLPELLQIRRARLRDLRTGLRERTRLADAFLPRPTPRANEPEPPAPAPPTLKLKRYLNE
jgi:putative transposase